MKRNLIALILAGLALATNAAFAEPTLDFNDGSWKQGNSVVQGAGQAQYEKHYESGNVTP
jgi:hypothetical protein